MPRLRSKGAHASLLAFIFLLHTSYNPLCTYLQMEQPEQKKVLKQWCVVYPVYLNARKSIAEGRRIAVSKACDNPTPQEIHDVCKYLGFEVELEVSYTDVHGTPTHWINAQAEKQYPRDYTMKGRVRIKLRKEDGEPVVPDLKTSMSRAHAYTMHTHSCTACTLAPYRMSTHVRVIPRTRTYIRTHAHAHTYSLQATTHSLCCTYALWLLPLAHPPVSLNCALVYYFVSPAPSSFSSSTCSLSSSFCLFAFVFASCCALFRLQKKRFLFDLVL